MADFILSYSIVKKIMADEEVEMSKKEEMKKSCSQHEESAWEKTKEMSDAVWHKTKEAIGDMKHKITGEEEKEEKHSSCNAKHMH